MNLTEFEKKKLEALHSFCSHNQVNIYKSKLCGCFYCLELFPAEEIIDWTDENSTALCAKCGIDSVLCDYDVELSVTLLLQMKKYWF